MNILYLMRKRNQYNKIKSDFDKIGIKIYGIRDLEVEVWEIIYTCLSELIDLYPIINNGSLAWIRVEDRKYFNYVRLSRNTLASSGFFVLKHLKPYVDLKRRLGIVFNKLEFNCIGNNEVVGNKKVDKKTFIRAIAAHEFGHLLDLIISGYNPMSCKNWESYNKIDKRYKKKESDSIVENAFKRYFGGNEPKIQIIVEQIGEYASRSKDEIFAEAIAMHYCGLDSGLSLMIIEELSKVLKDG